MRIGIIGHAGRGISDALLIAAVMAVHSAHGKTPPIVEVCTLEPVRGLNEVKLELENLMLHRAETVIRAPSLDFDFGPECDLIEPPPAWLRLPARTGIPPQGGSSIAVNRTEKAGVWIRAHRIE